MPTCGPGGGCGGAVIVPPVNSWGGHPICTDPTAAPRPQPQAGLWGQRESGRAARGEWGRCPPVGRNGAAGWGGAAGGCRGARPLSAASPAPGGAVKRGGMRCLSARPCAVSATTGFNLERRRRRGTGGGRVGGRRCPLLRGDGGGSAGPPPPGGDPGERGELCPQRRSARHCGEGGPRPHHGDTPGGSAAHGRHGDGAAPHAVLRPRLTAGIRRGRTAHSAQHTAHSTRRTAHGPRHPTHPRRARRIHAAPLWVTGAVGALRRPTAWTRTKAAGAGGLRGPPPHLSAAGSGPGPAELTLQPCTNHLQDNGESVQAAKTNSAGGQAARHPTAPPRPPQRRSPAHSSR